jgi:hypothetical protein
LREHYTIPDTKTVAAALLDFDDADKRVGRINQIKSHGVYSVIDRNLLFLPFFLNAGLMNGILQLLFVALIPDYTAYMQLYSKAPRP